MPKIRISASHSDQSCLPKPLCSMNEPHIVNTYNSLLAVVQNGRHEKNVGALEISIIGNGFFLTKKKIG